MKNYLLFLLSGVLLTQFNSCTSKKGGEGQEDINKIVLDYSNTNTEWTSNQELASMHLAYTSDSKNQTYEDTSGKSAYKYVDFKLEELKHLIWLMEKSSKLTYGNSNKPEMGIRVHYAQYTKDENKGLNTVVLSPVFRNGTSNKTFNPRSKSNIEKKSFQSWSISDYEKSIKGSSNKLFMYFIPPYDDEGTNLNHGMGCPKVCQ